jgi:hypothetical protein
MQSLRDNKALFYTLIGMMPLLTYDVMDLILYCAI